MEPTIGDIVLVLRGRDAGRAMMVVGRQGNRYLVADGQIRHLSRPKRKNARHLSHLAGPGAWLQRLKEGQWSDAELRALLQQFDAKGGKEDAER